MTTRRTPDGQVYTEVPVVPRHDQLDGRELGNSHPISAITGLQDALDSKADAVDGGNLVTDAEKELLATLEEGAQPNVIEEVKVNGVALEPDASKAVDVTVPTAYGKSLTYSGSSGKLALKGPTGTTLSEATLPRKGLTGLALNSDTKVLTATLQDGSTVTANIGAAADPYTAGNGLSLANGAFSLSAQTEDLMEDIADHLSDQTAHVSTADRTAWNGVVSNAVKTSGDQTVGGSKTFSSPVTVATPTANGHAATKAYVDAAVAGGGGGGTAYTAGEGLTLDGTEFSLDSATQSTLASVSDKAEDDEVVKLTGAQTVAGIKTFSSIPLIPTDTPTQNAQVASKAYVDAAVAGGGGGGGGTTYTAGTGLQLVGTEFSLDSSTQGKVAGAVQNTGAETIAGVKTFSSSPLVPTPTTDYQIATKKYVDDTIPEYTAGLGMSINNGIIGLDQDYANNLVNKTGNQQTISSLIVFNTMPHAPGTPTNDSDVANKKYVDDTVAGGGGGSGTWTVLQPEDYASTTFSTLFSGSGSPYVALKDVHIVVYWGGTILCTHTFLKGEYLNVNLSGAWATGAGNTSTQFAKIYRLILKDLIYSSISTNSVGAVYSFTGVSSSTTTAANVKGVAETNSYGNVIHQSAPAAVADGKVGVFIQYR